MEKMSLLCTFTTPQKLENTVEEIKKTYGMVKIFILGDKNDNNKIICTYNVLKDVTKFLSKTILVHRKQKFNTIYTINALNFLITSLNDGEYNPNYSLKWDDYKNTILLVKDNVLEKIETFFIKYQ